jgi:hypothetical protein
MNDAVALHSSLHCSSLCLTFRLCGAKPTNLVPLFTPTALKRRFILGNVQVFASVSKLRALEGLMQTALPEHWHPSHRVVSQLFIILSDLFSRCFPPRPILRCLTFILLMWKIGRVPNSIPIYLYIQQDTKSHSLFISGNCSKCFGWYFHPSSGAHTTVSTASGVSHTVTAICHYRGRVGTSLSVL